MSIANTHRAYCISDTVLSVLCLSTHLISELRDRNTIIISFQTRTEIQFKIVEGHRVTKGERWDSNSVWLQTLCSYSLSFSA